MGIISDWKRKKTKSQGNKMFEGVEMAPFRSIDEYLTSESKFEMPELSNIEKMSGKVVSNLLYYQTNYFVSFAIIFLLVFFFVPWKMIYIVILLALVFSAQYYMSLHHVHVKVWKRTHPTAVMSATFVIAMFFSLPVWMVYRIFLVNIYATSSDCHPCFPPCQGQDPGCQGAILEEEEGN